MVIGAGPAGLALGNILSKKSSKYLILEKGSVGNSFSNMPDNLSLITYWRSNYLRGEDKNLYDLDSVISAKSYAEYLRKIGQGLNIRENTVVKSVEKIDRIFHITTEEGVFLAKKVVDASGYFSKPFTPSFSKVNPTCEMIHFSQYKNNSIIGSDDRVLIVGARLSAGQLLEEVAQRTKNLFLCTRGEVKFSSKESIRKWCLRNIKFIDFLISLFSLRKKLEVYMDLERRPLIENIRKYPEIFSVEGRVVTFKNGQSLEVDKIIFATGFCETTPHITGDYQRGHIQSFTTPGLYFLGRECLFNFKSRFLRGIREDAFRLAKKIEETL